VEVSPTLQLFPAQGPMARHAADLRAAFEIMAGEDPVDPWSLPASAPRAARPRRVAVIVDPAGLGVDVQVADGVRRAAAALADAGYDVVEEEPPAVAEAAAMWLSLVGTEARLNAAQWTL